MQKIIKARNYLHRRMTLRSVVNWYFEALKLKIAVETRSVWCLLQNDVSESDVDECLRCCRQQVAKIIFPLIQWNWKTQPCSIRTATMIRIRYLIYPTCSCLFWNLWRLYWIPYPLVLVNHLQLEQKKMIYARICGNIRNEWRLYQLEFNSWLICAVLTPTADML